MQKGSKCAAVNDARRRAVHIVNSAHEKRTKASLHKESCHVVHSLDWILSATAAFRVLAQLIIMSQRFEILTMSQAFSMYSEAGMFIRRYKRNSDTFGER